MNSTILIGSGCFSVDFNKLWLSCLSFLQTSMNVPALKQTSVTPTLSVATLKDRIPVAVVKGIPEMAKTVPVIFFVLFYFAPALKSAIVVSLVFFHIMLASF